MFLKYIKYIQKSFPLLLLIFICRLMLVIRSFCSLTNSFNVFLCNFGKIVFPIFKKKLTGRLRLLVQKQGDYLICKYSNLVDILLFGLIFKIDDLNDTIIAKSLCNFLIEIPACTALLLTSITLSFALKLVFELHKQMFNVFLIKITQTSFLHRLSQLQP